MTETYVRPGSVLAEAPLAALMQVEPGTELAEYSYFGQRDKRPYSLARIYVPLDLAERLETPTGRLPWGAEICVGLEAAGVRLARITERVTTRLRTHLDYNSTSQRSRLNRGFKPRTTAPSAPSTSILITLARSISRSLSS